MIAMFSRMQALTKLDEIEQQLTCTDLPRNSAALADLHAYMSGAINEVSAPALRDGRALLERVGRDAPGEQGISVKVSSLGTATSRSLPRRRGRYRGVEVGTAAATTSGARVGALCSKNVVTLFYSVFL